jgi:periplasmic protein TonB
VSRRADIVTAAVAVAVHAVAAIAIAHQHPRAVAVRPRPVEVELRRPPPPPPPQGAAPRPTAAPAPRAPRPIARKVALSPAPQPIPPAPSPPRRAAPLPPVYGFAMESPTDASSTIAAARGGAGIADPAGKGGNPRGGPPGPPGETGAGGELAIKTMPEVDTDACGRSISYPPEAERAGIEGKVRLRVALDARGRVSSARVLRGLGHGLDEAAVEALTRRCRFTPAIASDGRPVPFVIESYSFLFELPR